MARVSSVSSKSKKRGAKVLEDEDADESEKTGSCAGFLRSLLGGHDIDTHPASVKSSKKRKTVAPRTSASHGDKPRRRSALDALPDMPLDILDEVRCIRL